MHLIIHLTLNGFALLVGAILFLRVGMANLQGPLPDACVAHLLGAIRHLLDLMLTLTLWCTICRHICMGALHVPLLSIRTLAETGSALQRLFGFCVYSGPPLLLLALIALFFASFELEGDGVSPQDLVPFHGNALLDALVRPFGVATLVSRREVGTRDAMGALFGVAFLTFLACGTLAIAG